jgi:RNA polymerase sigma factor (sigma-70 family)
MKNKTIIEYRNNPSEEKLEVILEENRNLIHSLANKFKVSIFDYDFFDLVQEGMCEAIDAIKKYDITSEATFSTYLYTRVKYRFIKIVRRNKAQKRDIGNYITLESRINHSNLTYESCVSDTSSNIYANKASDIHEDLIYLLREFLNEDEIKFYILYINTGDTNYLAEKYNMSVNSTKNKITSIRRKIRNNRKK